jgi:hypothetical protein
MAEKIIAAVKLMRLVDKQRPAVALEPLAAEEAAALRQWFESSAEERQKQIVHSLLRSAKAREAWIECDCVKGNGSKPLSAPVLANGVFTVRRLVSTELTGVGPRPNHDPSCPFHYDEVHFRDRPDVLYVERPHLLPSGSVPALPLISGALAERRERIPRHEAPERDNLPVPSTAVTLWRLMHASGVNVIEPDAILDDMSLTTSLTRLRKAAAQMVVSHNLPWSTVLSTYPGDFADPASRWRATFARIARNWRKDERATASMLAAARDVGEFSISTLRHGDIPVRSLVRKPLRGDARGRGPFLVLVLFGNDVETGALAAERAYAQPALSLDMLFPVENGFERQVLAAMLEARAWLTHHDPMVRLQIGKPLFDLMTEAGPCRPDFLINCWTADDPRPRRLIVEARGMETERYRLAKAATIPRMRMIAPVHEITPDAFQHGPDIVTAWFTDVVQERARQPAA